MRKRLWLVDDDHDVLLMMAEIFKNDYEIEVFDSGSSLLTSLAGRRPNVIVSDFQMPGLTGLTLADSIRQMGCFAPVILISGFVDKSVYSHAMESHVYKVVEKPFSTKDLLETVDRAVAAEAFQTITRDLRETSEEIFNVAFSAMTSYRERAEDAERLLKELGLLPNSKETQLQRFVKASELEAKAEELKRKLQELDDLEGGLHGTNLLVARLKAA